MISRPILLALLLHVLLVVTPRASFALSCINVREVSPFEIIWSSDVVFVGERLSDENGGDTNSYVVVQSFKGSVTKNELVTALPADVYFVVAGAPRYIRLSRTSDHYIIFAKRGADGTLVQTRFSGCSKFASVDQNLKLFRAYKYRYLILLGIALLIFSIYKVGGIRKFVTTDIRQIAKTVFAFKKNASK